MKKLLIFLGAAVILLVVCLAAAISIRNGLIASDESVNESWSQIENQLQRRADLIPNLVSTVKGYAAHESKVFADVADARARLLAANGAQAKAEANAGLDSALGRLLAIAERYPDLKANQAFLRLQDELAGTENRISVARMRYNGAVREFNASIRQFPGSLFAGSLGLTKRDYFEAPEGRAAVEKAPKVVF